MNHFFWSDKSHWIEHYGTPWAAMIAGGLAYFVLAQIGFIFLLPGVALSVFWPPNSMAVAALILSPRSWRLHVVVGIVLGDIFGELMAGSLGEALLFSAINAFQYCGAALIFARFCGPHVEKLTVRGFLILASSYNGLLAPLGAFLVAGFLCFKIGGSADFWLIWRSWYVSDILCIVSLTHLRHMALQMCLVSYS